MRSKFFKVILILFLIMPFITQGDIIDDIDRQIQDQENKRIELERKAAEYQAVINQKQGEIKTLNNQVAIFNARINKLEVEINITEDDVIQTELEIKQLEYGIEETIVDILSQKNNLASIIQTLAELDQTTQLELILASENFSDFFNQTTYLDNLQNSVKEKVDILKSFKIKLNNDKETEEQKKEKLVGFKDQLDSQKWSLASQRNSQKSLLNETKGEESNYQKLLANIEAQKKSLLGDINRLMQQKASELARLKELQEKPPSQYWASLNWYYKQNDPKWTNTTIGISNSTMGDYGCAVTDVAMIFTYHGSTISPGQLAKASIFSWDLIYWPTRWGNIQCMNCPAPHTSSFDWFRLDRELGAGYPVIVFIRAVGRSGGHYVIIHHKTSDGRYVVHDPLFGANIYLESTQVYISNLYDTTTILDQMIIYH